MADPSTAWLKPLYTWRSAITESNLSHTTKHIALTLSLHMSERGDSCFPGRKLLAAETGLDLRTIDRHLKILAAIDENGVEDLELAWLRVKRGIGRGKTNEYFAVVPGTWERATSAPPRVQDPAKTKARNTLNKAIRDGRLKRPDRCSRCGKQGLIEAHHADYSKPLEVEWLCTICHQAETEVGRQGASHKDVNSSAPMGTDNGGQGAAFRGLIGGTEAEGEAQDTQTGGTVPPEYSSSSTESKDARAREPDKTEKQPNDEKQPTGPGKFEPIGDIVVKVPDLPTLDFRDKLVTLWRQMWEYLEKTPGPGIRYNLPNGLKVDATKVPYDGSTAHKSRRLVIWREGSFKDYEMGELSPALQKWENERDTFWKHVFVKNRQAGRDWIEGSAAGYPAFHVCWTERMPRSLRA